MSTYSPVLCHVVHRDVSSPPKQITNTKGKLILAHNSRLNFGMETTQTILATCLYDDLFTEHPLAEGFDILDGKFNVTIPKDTKPGKNYQLVRK